MTPRRDATTGFPFTHAQWTAPASSGKISPTVLPHLVARYYLASQTAIKDGGSVSMNEHNCDITSKANACPAVQVAIPTEQYLSRLCHLQKSATSSAEESNRIEFCRADAQAHSPNSAENNVRAMAQNLTNADKANFVLSYGNQLSRSHLAALATNQQLSAHTSISYPLSGTVQSKLNYTSAIDPVFGNLLPPPPLLPVATANVSQSCGGFPYSSSVSKFLSTSKAIGQSNSSSDLKTTSSIPQSIRNTSIFDRNQPLDLSITKRQRSDKNSKNDEHDSVINDRVKSGANATHSPPTTPSSQAFPVGVSPYRVTHNSTPSSSAAEHGARQHVPSGCSFVETANSLSLPTLQEQALNLNSESLKEFSQDYFQKWLYVAQQHRCAAAVQQATKTRRKRPRSNEYSSETPRKRSFEQYSATRKSSSSSSDLTSGGSDQGLLPGNIAANNHGKRYKRYAKPPYSYVALITLAILSSPEKKLRLSQILKRIAEMFPFFKGSYQGWRDSVRHNLSQNECFVKVLKNPYRPTAKGNYWAVNTETIPRDLMTRQNTLVSRFVQDSGYNYRKDLTEVFDNISGKINVKIPPHLLNGTELINDPAAIMEALLLESKGDEETALQESAATGASPKVYSLVDLFIHEEVLDEDLFRHSNGTGRTKWAEKGSKTGQSVNTRSHPLAQQLEQTAATTNANTVDSQHQQLVLEMLKSASKHFNPLNYGQHSVQKELLTDIISSTNHVSLPVLLTLCNNAQQIQQVYKTSTPGSSVQQVPKRENDDSRASVAVVNAKLKSGKNNSENQHGSSDLLPPTGTADLSDLSAASAFNQG